MKSWILKAAACVPLALAPVVARAGAGPAIDWDPAYIWQAGATPTNLPAGGELKIVCKVSQFGPPLDSLDTSDPTREYTFYVHGLISQGTVASGPPSLTTYSTDYSGGTFELYVDTGLNSVFAPNPPNALVPSTFTDGTLLLTGSFSGFTVQTNNFTSLDTGNAEGSIVWTGGPLLPKFNQAGGPPCSGLFTGGITWYPPTSIAGYLFRDVGKIDAQCPVPVRRSTWGRLKSLYH